jgi:translation initiation factor 1A
MILVALRDFQDDKVDVIHKYSTDQARRLKQLGEIPAGAKIAEATLADSDSDTVEFVFSEI